MCVCVCVCVCVCIFYHGIVLAHLSTSGVKSSSVSQSVIKHPTHTHSCCLAAVCVVVQACRRES